MSTISKESILHQLHWRYATKKFDPTKKIPTADWEALEQAVLLSPSSYGLQPWKFFVVTDRAVRAKLQPAAYNQPQILDASHLVVFAVRSPLTPECVQSYMERIAIVRSTTVESLSDYHQRIVGHLQSPGFDALNWASKQVYIALGVFLTIAAMLGIDACPMEGFVPEKFDEILGLKEKGYASRVLATAGYRSVDDKYAHNAKVRFQREDMFEHI